MNTDERPGSELEPGRSPLGELDRPEPIAEPPAMIEIDGVRYPVPLLDSLDLDEEQILFDISGITQPDFMPAHPESPPDIRAAVDLAIAVRIRNPAFKRAVIAIAYRRGNPGVSFDDLLERIGAVNALDAELALNGKDPYAGEEAAEADPTPSSAGSS